METTEIEKEKLQQLLVEAIDLLHDERHKFGMFQSQRYWRLRHSIERSKMILLKDNDSLKNN